MVNIYVEHIRCKLITLKTTRQPPRSQSGVWLDVDENKARQTPICSWAISTYLTYINDQACYPYASWEGKSVTY